MNKISCPFIFFIFLLIGPSIHAQVGVIGSYFTQRIPEWETAIVGNTSSNRILENGYSVGVDFWMKPLEEWRLELYPEMVFSNSTSELIIGSNTESLALTTVGFNLNVNIYLLNFKSDCDCPTFSKQESFFEKGLFLQLSPGFHYLNGAYEIDNSFDLQKSTLNDWVPQLGIGLGVDIGLTDFITITPIVKYNRFLNASWDGLLAIVDEPNNSALGSEESNINRFSAGIHIGIRWQEYSRSRPRRRR